jgi:hypothetical protein
LVVIATNNNIPVLMRLLASIDRHSDTFEIPSDLEVLVVGTAPGEGKRVKDALQGRTWRFTLAVDETPWAGYDTGAYLWAYWNHAAEEFLFMHDSCEITGPGWYEQFYVVHQETGALVVPWCTFSPYLLGVVPVERECIVSTYGLYEEPGYGFFGPIFWATRTALDRIAAAGYMHFVPSTKVQAQACERFWALYCSRLRIPVAPVHRDGYHIVAQGGQHPLISKHFVRRT